MREIRVLVCRKSLITTFTYLLLCQHFIFYPAWKMAVRLSLTLRHPLLPTSYPIPVRATQFRRFAVQNCVSDSDDSRKVLSFHSLSTTSSSRLVHIACREIPIFHESAMLECCVFGLKLRPQTSLWLCFCDLFVFTFCQSSNMWPLLCKGQLFEDLAALHLVDRAVYMYIFIWWYTG